MTGPAWITPEDETMETHMTTRRTRPAPAAQTTFGAKLDALIGVTGHRMPCSHLTGVYLAGKLGISASQYSRKRSGLIPVTERECCILVDEFRIGSQVDYRVFLEPDVDSFLARLKEAGVGTYGADRRSALCQLLFGASLQSRYKVRFSRVIGPFARRGPLGLAEHGKDSVPVLRIGGRVNIECAGPEGRNLVVLSTSLDYGRRDTAISILMPSLFAPDTRVAGPKTTLPTDRDLDAFDVTSDVGEHRLYALWTDDQVVAAIRRAPEVLTGVVDMDDDTAGAVAALVSAEPPERRAVATCDYVVER